LAQKETTEEKRLRKMRSSVQFFGKGLWKGVSPRCAAIARSNASPYGRAVIAKGRGSLSAKHGVQ